MKVFIVIACLTLAWAVPTPQVNIQELDGIPADDAIRINFVDSDSDVNKPEYLPQIIKVADVLKEYEANVKREDTAQNVPEIEPLDGPEVNADSLENDVGYEPGSEILMPVNENDQDDIQVAALSDNDEDDRSGLEEIQIVDIDSNDFRGFMGIAPSELDSLRVYFEDDMAREIADRDNQAAEILINYDDPSLR